MTVGRALNPKDIETTRVTAPNLQMAVRRGVMGKADAWLKHIVTILAKSAPLPLPTPHEVSRLSDPTIPTAELRVLPEYWWRPAGGSGAGGAPAPVNTQATRANTA